MGEVGRQATLPIGNHGLNLTQALGEAGGMNQTQADATGVFVIRRAPEDAVKPIHIYQLNLKDATAYALGNDLTAPQRHRLCNCRAGYPLEPRSVANNQLRYQRQLYRQHIQIT